MPPAGWVYGSRTFKPGGKSWTWYDTRQRGPCKKHTNGSSLVQNFRQVLRVSLTGATLAFVAGYVNAVSLSSVYRLTVTHMTVTTIHAFFSPGWRSRFSLGGLQGVVARLGLDISQLANPSVSERSLGDDIAADLCVLFGFLIGSVCTGIVVGPSLYAFARLARAPTILNENKTKTKL